MTVMLAGSLGVAWSVTDAAVGNPLGPKLESRQAVGLELAVPRRWVTRDDLAQPFGEQARMWVDAARPSKKLLVQPLTMTSTRMDVALSEYQRRAMPDIQPSPELFYEDIRDGGTSVPTLGRLWMAEQDPRRQHFITMIRSPEEPLKFWVMHLIDIAGPGEQPAKVFMNNAYLMSKIIEQTRPVVVENTSRERN